MNAMSVPVPATNSLSTEKFDPISDMIRAQSPTSHKDGLIHKSLLSCNSCSWSVSYKDYSDSLDVMQEYATVTCPVCKDGRINSSVMMIS
ncbi:MAG: hypothetical protein ACTHKP_15765 [Nitrososphaeraceae archaeon]